MRPATSSILLTALLALPGTGWGEQRETLVRGQAEHGGFGGPELRLTRLNGGDKHSSAAAGPGSSTTAIIWAAPATAPPDGSKAPDTTWATAGC